MLFPPQLYGTLAAMVSNKSERRSGARVAVRVPLSVSTPTQTLPASAHTRDLSTNGIFFYTDFPFTQGNDVEMVLILPSELTNGEKRWVCCKATVVRVESSSDGNTRGIAAKVRTMEFLPELVG